MLGTALFSYKAGSHFISKFVIHCQHTEHGGLVRQVVFNVFVLLVHKIRQSAKLNDGFAPVSIYQAVFIPQSPNFHWICENLQFKYTSCCDHFQRWHEGVQTKSLWFMTPLSLLREVNIRFLSFSVYQLPFRAFVWGREVFHFMKPNKGDLGADTDQGVWVLKLLAQI